MAGWLLRNQHVQHRVGRLGAHTRQRFKHSHPALFADYGSGRAVFDRLVECFGADLCQPQGAGVADRLRWALQTVTGFAIEDSPRIDVAVPEDFHSGHDAGFWMGEFLNRLTDCCTRYRTAILVADCAVVGDLFYPATNVPWGLRGDPFLWMEMAQALCHVPLPEYTPELDLILSSTFAALTGQSLDHHDSILVPRFARGGMSSGQIATSHWKETLIPLLHDRTVWLWTSLFSTL